MSSKGKIYYLNTEELAVLLALEGLNSLYGIKMNIENSDKKSVYKTMFTLQKQSILKVNGKNIEILSDIKEVIENIKKAKKLVVYQSRSMERQQKLIYLGKNPIIVSPCGINGDMLQIETVEYDELVGKICDEGFSLDEMVSDEGLYNNTLIDNEIIIEDARRIFILGVNTMEDEKWGYGVSCLSVIDIDNRKCQRQYLLMEEGMNDYIAVTDESTTKLYAYSMRLVTEILYENLLGIRGD